MLEAIGQLLVTASRVSSCKKKREKLTKKEAQYNKAFKDYGNVYVTDVFLKSTTNAIGGGSIVIHQPK